VENELLPVHIISEYKLRAENSRLSILEGIPKIKLKQENMTNCQLILDREKLLEYMPKNAVIAEIGVNKGDFSRKIIGICKPQKLHLIDSWHTERYHDGLSLDVENKFSQEISNGKIKINRGLSTEIVDEFSDKYFDWVYIDTSHDYITTKMELEKYSKKLKDGGILAGHDYSMGNWGKGYKYGVIEAVHEFCVNNHWELIFLTADFTENQSFAIRKIIK
jgi:hypothetical protein